MPDKFLRKYEIAAMFGTSWDRAASILRENGVYPVDYGRGRGNGLRWLESAAIQVLRSLHNNAQPSSDPPGKKKIPRPKRPGISLADMPLNAIFELVGDHQIH